MELWFTNQTEEKALCATDAIKCRITTLSKVHQASKHTYLMERETTGGCQDHWLCFRNSSCQKSLAMFLDQITPANAIQCMGINPTIDGPTGGEGSALTPT
ncbi:hypothetical protein J004_00415 [Cryptococcus neoformans]|nr:hypothetical protein J004_00415 [Cryptococcus neoformans var. grubii]